jgi:hypothetical protein
MPVGTHPHLLMAVIGRSTEGGANNYNRAMIACQKFVYIRLFLERSFVHYRRQDLPLASSDISFKTIYP